MIAPLAWVFLPNGPGECRFLNEQDNEIIRLRALSGRGREEKGKLNMRQVFAAFYDYKNYFNAAIVFCLNVSAINWPGDDPVLTIISSDCLCSTPSLLTNNHRRHWILLHPSTRSLSPSVSCVFLPLPVGIIPIRSSTKPVSFSKCAKHCWSCRISRPGPCGDQRSAILCNFPDLRWSLPRCGPGIHLGNG